MKIKNTEGPGPSGPRPGERPRRPDGAPRTRPGRRAAVRPGRSRRQAAHRDPPPRPAGEPVIPVVAVDPATRSIPPDGRSPGRRHGGLADAARAVIRGAGAAAREVAQGRRPSRRPRRAARPGGSVAGPPVAGGPAARMTTGRVRGGPSGRPWRWGGTAGRPGRTAPPARCRDKVPTGHERHGAAGTGAAGGTGPADSCRYQWCGARIRTHGSRVNSGGCSRRRPESSASAIEILRRAPDVIQPTPAGNRGSNSKAIRPVSGRPSRLGRRRGRPAHPRTPGPRTPGPRPATGPDPPSRGPPARLRCLHRTTPRHPRRPPPRSDAGHTVASQRTPGIHLPHGLGSGKRYHGPPGPGSRALGEGGSAITAGRRIRAGRSDPPHQDRRRVHRFVSPRTMRSAVNHVLGEEKCGCPSRHGEPRRPHRAFTTRPAC